MQLQLANNEKIIKDWTYATYTEDKETTEHNLTVTNKRVIISEKSEAEMHRSELLIDNVVGVTCEYAKNQSNPKMRTGVVLLIIGSLFLIGGIVLCSLVDIYSALAFIILGPIMIIAGIVVLLGKKISGTLSVVIHTNMAETNTSYSIYANTNTIQQKFKNSTVKVAVNLTVAEEIVDTIGALIVAKDA